MDSKTRKTYLCRLNDGFNLKLSEGYLNRQIPEEDWKIQQLKHCDNKKKNESISENVNHINNNFSS